MSEPRVTFKEITEACDKTYRFFDDRIECDWSAIIRRGQATIPTNDIDARIDEQTTFAFGAGKPLRNLAICAVTGVVLQVGFGQPALKFIAFCLYGLAASGGVLALSRLRKETWLYVRRANGQILLCIRTKGLRGITPDQFRAEIRRYAGGSATPGGLREMRDSPI